MLAESSPTFRLLPMHHIASQEAEHLFVVPTPCVSPLVPEMHANILLKLLLGWGIGKASASRSHNMNRAIWSVSSNEGVEMEPGTGVNEKSNSV